MDKVTHVPTHSLRHPTSNVTPHPGPSRLQTHSHHKSQTLKLHLVGSPSGAAPTVMGSQNALLPVTHRGQGEQVGIETALFRGLAI